MLQTYTCKQYTIIHNTCKNESKHSEMGPVRQNPIQRTVSLFICVCIALCTIVAYNIAQNRPDSFPPYPPDDHHNSMRSKADERQAVNSVTSKTNCHWQLSMLTMSTIIATTAAVNSVRSKADDRQAVNSMRSKADERQDVNSVKSKTNCHWQMSMLTTSTIINICFILLVKHKRTTTTATDVPCYSPVPTFRSNHVCERDTS